MPNTPAPSLSFTIGNQHHEVSIFVDSQRWTVDLKIGDAETLHRALLVDSDVEIRIFRLVLLICAGYCDEAILRRARMPYEARPVLGSFNRIRVELAANEDVAQVRSALTAAAGRIAASWLR